MSSMGSPMAPMPFRSSSALGAGFGRAESPRASERVAGALAVAAAPLEPHCCKTGEADAEHRPGRGLGNRERGHVAVDGKPERTGDARPGDLDEVGPGLLVVAERGGRADYRRLAAGG